jgi:hypothetical protein
LANFPVAYCGLKIITSLRSVLIGENGKNTGKQEMKVAILMI